MSDVECPYCKAGQEINHDDGYGYEEDVQHKQNCVSCQKEFIFTTSITIYYEILCADGQHKLEPSIIKGYEHHNDCMNCDYYELLCP